MQPATKIIDEKEFNFIANKLLKIVYGKNLYTLSEIISCFLNILIDQNRIKDYNKFIRDQAIKMLLIYKLNKNIYDVIDYLKKNKKYINSRDKAFIDNVDYIQNKAAWSEYDSLLLEENYSSEEIYFCELDISKLSEFVTQKIKKEYAIKHKKLINKLLELSIYTYEELKSIGMRSDLYNKFIKSVNSFYNTMTKKSFEKQYNLQYVLEPLIENGTSYENREIEFISRVKEFFTCQLYINIFISELKKVKDINYLLENRDKNKETTNEWARVRVTIKRRFLASVEDFYIKIDEIMKKMIK